MILSAITETDSEESKALHKRTIATTQVESDLQGIVEIASQICNAPIVLVNLRDEKMQWISACNGIESRLINVRIKITTASAEIFLF